MASLVLVAALSATPYSGAVFEGHAPTPLVFQGHSPIVLLVTDPKGGQFGCTAIPCTSITSSNFKNTLNKTELPATYDFSTNTITITNPFVGTWTVEYIGTSSGTFTITATTCPETNSDTKNSGHDEPGCSNLLPPLHDPDDKPITLTITSGSVTSGSVNSVSIDLNSDGTITIPSGVPEFPIGMGLFVSVLLVGLVLLRPRLQKRMKPI